MNQADVSKLMSQLRIAIQPRHRNLKNIDGPEGRLMKLRKTVTALFKHERIELNYNRADEARGYAELLISSALRHGDRHNETMELADFWLLEKQQVHKLFKVLVPRFQNCKLSYTKIYKAPREYPGMYYQRSVLELRGNPYPSLLPDFSLNRNLLHNILLDEARKDYHKEKLADITSKLTNNTEKECRGDSIIEQEIEQDTNASVKQAAETVNKSTEKPIKKSEKETSENINTSKTKEVNHK